jgi:hypothetical protein
MNTWRAGRRLAGRRALVLLGQPAGGWQSSGYSRRPGSSRPSADHLLAVPGGHRPGLGDPGMAAILLLGRRWSPTNFYRQEPATARVPQAVANHAPAGSRDERIGRVEPDRPCDAGLWADRDSVPGGLILRLGWPAELRRARAQHAPTASLRRQPTPVREYRQASRGGEAEVDLTAPFGALCATC